MHLNEENPCKSCNQQQPCPQWAWVQVQTPGPLTPSLLGIPKEKGSTPHAGWGRREGGTGGVWEHPVMEGGMQQELTGLVDHLYRQGRHQPRAGALIAAATGHLEQEGREASAQICQAKPGLSPKKQHGEGSPRGPRGSHAARRYHLQPRGAGPIRTSPQAAAPWFIPI